MSVTQKRIMFWHLIGTGSFNIVDYILTLEFLEIGFHEANPIMASMVHTYEFPLVKLILVPLLLLALWQNKDRFKGAAAKLSWVPFMSYFVLMVYYSVLLSGNIKV